MLNTRDKQGLVECFHLSLKICLGMKLVKVLRAINRDVCCNWLLTVKINANCPCLPPHPLLTHTLCRLGAQVDLC